MCQNLEFSSTTGLRCATILLSLLASLGAQAPLSSRLQITRFTVEDPGGRPTTYSASKGKVAVVVFVSTRCPISNAFNFRLNALYNDFSREVAFLVIDSNVNESAEEIRTHARAMEYDFPVYRDIANQAADALGAKATPDSFVIDRNGRVSYHGYIEDGLNPQRTTNPALRLAIEAALDNRPAPTPETHARGCAIRRAGF